MIRRGHALYPECRSRVAQRCRLGCRVVRSLRHALDLLKLRRRVRRGQIPEHTFPGLEQLVLPALGPALVPPQRHHQQRQGNSTATSCNLSLARGAHGCLNHSQAQTRSICDSGCAGVYRLANTSAAACTVSAISCAVCAPLTKPASYKAGAMYMPLSSKP